MREILRQVFKRVTLEDDDIRFLERVRGESARDKRSSIAQGMKFHGQAINTERCITMFAGASLSAVLARLTLDAVPVLETVELIKTIGNGFAAPYDWSAEFNGGVKTVFFVAGFTVLDIMARGLGDRQKTKIFPELGHIGRLPEQSLER